MEFFMWKTMSAPWLHMVVNWLHYSLSLGEWATYSVAHFLIPRIDAEELHRFSRESLFDSFVKAIAKEQEIEKNKGT